MFKEFVYVLKAGPYYKIGRTIDLTSRVGQIQLQMPFKVELFKVFNVEDSKAFEAILHLFNLKTKVNGEWFELDDLSAMRIWMAQSTYCKAYLTEGFPYDAYEMFESATRIAEEQQAQKSEAIQSEDGNTNEMSSF